MPASSEGPHNPSVEHINNNATSDPLSLESLNPGMQSNVRTLEQIDSVELDQEQRERREEMDKNHVTHFVVTMLNQITAWKLKALREGKEVSLREIWALLREHWPNNDGRGKARFSIPNARNGTRVYFQNEANDYDIANGEISLGIKEMLDATTEEEVQNATSRLIEIAYHEAEHIYSPGSEELEPTPQGAIEYQGNDGEIKAHARQYAFRYLQAYPGEDFDLIKMLALVTPTDVNAHNYFVVFANPEKQEQYRKWGDLAEMHKKIVSETTRMVEMLKRYATHSNKP